MIQKQFIKQLYQTFALNQRPEMAVDDPMHCLSCEETQKAHSNLPNLKLVSVDDFRVCYLSIGSLNENAFIYYLPKLLELALQEEKITQGILTGETITNSVVSSLIPFENDNRFENYSKDKIEIIIEVIAQIHKKYFKEDYGYWNFDFEYFEEEKDIQKLVASCEKALAFWKGKLKE